MNAFELQRNLKLKAAKLNEFGNGEWREEGDMEEKAWDKDQDRVEGDYSPLPQRLKMWAVGSSALICALLIPFPWMISILFSSFSVVVLYSPCFPTKRRVIQMCDVTTPSLPSLFEHRVAKFCKTKNKQNLQAENKESCKYEQIKSKEWKWKEEKSWKEVEEGRGLKLSCWVVDKCVDSKKDTFSEYQNQKALEK